VDTAGRAVGWVPAIELVTVGQRKGLGLPGGAEARYVVDVDVGAATVTVGTAADLRVGEQPVRDVRWVSGTPSGEVLVQCSAHGGAHRGAVSVVGASVVGGGVVRWAEPQRRVAPGQSLAVYDAADELVLGGAIAA
jgi:tRNA-specific 2-thiouridylase